MKSSLIKKYLDYKKIIKDFNLSVLTSEQRQSVADLIHQLLEIKFLDIILTNLTHNKQVEFQELTNKKPDRVIAFLHKNIKDFDKMVKKNLQDYKISLKVKLEQIKKDLAK
ncbi:hypothetical protein HY388_00285 [Candidatus Daviesbacteria bacterium]|nr:hypothetical protein [Candidatus Daviesbacteria bacterium]